MFFSVNRKKYTQNGKKITQKLLKYIIFTTFATKTLFVRTVVWQPVAKLLQLLHLQINLSLCLHSHTNKLPIYE